jgi:hypothetical protein
VMEVVVEMEEMETVAHDLTRLVVEGRPGTQARSRAGLDAFFSRPRRCTVGLAREGQILVLGRRVSETAFFPPRNRPSAPNRFASRHLYQFQERSCCPPIPRRTLRCWVSGGYKYTDIQQYDAIEARIRTERIRYKDKIHGFLERKASFSAAACAFRGIRTVC